MVRETVYSQAFNRCKVKDFFEILYADGTAAKAYHAEADKDDNAQVEAWEGNTRTVHFTMPMSIPPVVAKIIRTDKIPVKEVQQVETDTDGNLHVISTPHIGVPGGNKFVAVAKLKITDTNNGCMVEARVVCTSKGLIGLNGMIEGIMIEQSATSIKQYIAFCSRVCQSKLNRVEKGEPGSPRSDSTVFEQFFDAQEQLSRSTSFSSMASDSGQLTLGGRTGASTQELVDTVAIMKLLDMLDGRAQLLLSDLQAIRALIQPAVNLVPKTNSPARKGSWARSWFSGFSIGAAVTACVCAIVLRKNSLRASRLDFLPAPS